MADDKKAFIAYCDWKCVFDELPDNEAGKLIKHIFAYVNDENPESDSILIRAVFANIKSTLKRDLIKYNGKKEQWSDAGKKSAEKRALLKSNEIQRNPTDVESVATDSTVSVSVNDSVSVKDNVKENVIKEKINIIIDSPYGDGELHFMCVEYDKLNQSKYPKEFYKSFLEYWTGNVRIGSKKGKELWKTEKTFTLGGRLATSYKMTWETKSNYSKTNNSNNGATFATNRPD